MYLRVRMAPRKDDQPEATGGEWRSVRSSAWRGLGERRAESCVYAASAVGPLSDIVDGEEEEVGGVGGAYGRRIVGRSCVCTKQAGR